MYVVTRLLQGLLTLAGVSIVAFSATSVLGDPSYLILGEGASPAAVASYRAEHGLDLPAWQQYANYVTGAVRGDLGSSYLYRQPAVQVVLDRMPATMLLGATSLALAVVVGIPLGALSALRRGGLLDRGVAVLALTGQAVPGFFLGLILIIVFAVTLRWLPTGGTGGWRNLVLPSLTLGTYLLTLIVRFTRSAMLEVLAQDYIRTARAKGLGELTVVGVHVLRNVLITLVTIIGLQLSVLFSGAVVTETIFGWPGVGRLIVDAVQAHDFPILQAGVLLIASAVVAVNLLVDLLYGAVDPRVKLG